MNTIYISLAAILTLALVIGCSESDSNSTSSGSAGDIEGTYVYSLFRTFHLAGTVDNELEIIEDNYQNDGTGTYQVEADDGSFREQEPLTYQVLNTGEMNRRATLSDGSAFEMQGLFSHDKEAVVWIDNDHQDDASTANIGAGFGFKKPTSVLDFEGTYETVMVNNAKGAAAFKLSRLEYQINGDGTGHTISLNGHQR